MDLQQHDLAHEFPEYTEKMQTLKQSNAHFAKLADEYHEVNKEIRRVEGEGVPMTDEHFEELKKKRLTLKDQLYAMLIA